MYIKVREINLKLDENDIFVDVSKTSKIEQIKKKIEKERGIKINNQRLLYKGKQLENDLRVFDYDIQLNDVIQLVIRSEELTNTRSDNDKKEEEPSNSTNVESEERKKAESKYFKVGDLVDAHDPEYTAWFEGIIVGIWENNVDSQSKLNQEDVLFQVQLENFEHFADLEIEFKHIRQRSYYIYKRSELKQGMKVLVNYNIDEPDKRGFWYDCILTSITKKEIKGNILVGIEQTAINDCVIKFPNEIMRVEASCLLTEKTPDDFIAAPLRKCSYRCINCKDNKKRKCRECGCRICGLKDSPELIILCDECNYGHHTKCLFPPLEKVPEEDWFCPTCKVDENEIVKAGEKLKFSKKKAKMASSKNTNPNRDWGRGMACVGRTKECTIVPKNHYGPIPGVEVGTCWKFRLQVSEAGVHRPHVAGIHGRETDGAYSLVLSGGYEDDVDLGDEFYYTGSGGRDLSGNKRVSGQSCDQSLTRMNKALALNCNAEFNDTKGAVAKDWRKGKPVRVVRNFKLGKYSKYAPREGNRYDGIYKVVKYYPEKGKSGFIVWKYLLRRDDPFPAPWNKSGKEIDMVYPPGYTEAEVWKKKECKEIENGKRIKKKGTKRPGKIIDESTMLSKKCKQEPYILEPELMKLIEQDEQNLKLWNECKHFLSEGKQKFLSKVEELFLCICCQDIVHLPITTECKHNMCQDCLKRSFSAEIYTCPYCRFDLGRKYKMSVNEPLTSALKLLFPGYTKNR